MMNVGDLLRTGHVMAFECSVTALETQIGLLESPGCNHIRHLSWVGDVGAGDLRVLNTLWLLSIFGAHMPDVSVERSPPAVPDVSQVSLAAINALESLWCNASHSGPLNLGETWQQSKQSLMLYYNAEAHKRLLKFLLHRTQPGSRSPYLRAALLHVGRIFHFRVCNFIAFWKNGRFLMLLLIAQSRKESIMVY